MVSWALWTSGLLCCFMLLLLFYVVVVVVVAYLNMNAAVAHWVRAFAPQAEGWVFESTESLKQVVTAPLLNARQ